MSFIISHSNMYNVHISNSKFFFSATAFSQSSLRPDLLVTFIRLLVCQVLLTFKLIFWWKLMSVKMIGNNTGKQGQNITDVVSCTRKNER